MYVQVVNWFVVGWLVGAGISIVAIGEALLALIEIALNTRKAVIPENLLDSLPNYWGTRFTSAILIFAGWVCFVLALLLAILPLVF